MEFESDTIDRLAVGTRHILSTNERQLFQDDPVFRRLVYVLVNLAQEYQDYQVDDGRRLNEAVNVARALLDKRRLLDQMRHPAHPDTSRWPAPPANATRSR